MNQSQGILAMVLHAHLPFVRHPEKPKSLEELWLYEAITETYLPLLTMFERLSQDGVPWKITMSITPTLGTMLNDDLLRSRYVRHLENMIELSAKEVERTRFQQDFYELAQMYHKLYCDSLDLYQNTYERNLVSAFRSFQEQGFLEIIGSCATHGFLPLIDQKQAIDAQIGVGVDWYRQNFGCDPQGFWLPECGYKPEVDQSLHKHGIKYVILDTHGVLHSKPKPRYGIYAPVLSRSGVAFFGRDPESSKQVWSATEGYPGDYDYRDFYRDIGYDLEYDYIKPYLASENRGQLGIKYYRITGENKEKQPYNALAACHKAQEHAANFMFNREKQIEYLCQYMDRDPIIIAPYDAELFGHWWFEGPQWLEALIRKIAAVQGIIKLGSPGEYLKRYPINQVVHPSMSSWGSNGYNEVWLDDSNDWIYRHLAQIAKQMIELANVETDHQLITRALNQAGREVLLAQSSDWAFIMKADTMVEYARYRTKEHIQRFLKLRQQISTGKIDEHLLIDLEQKDNIFPNLDYRVFRQGIVAKSVARII